MAEAKAAAGATATMEVKGEPKAPAEPKHPAHVGQMVHWYMDGVCGSGCKPFAAIVARLGMGTSVSLNIIEPGRVSFIIRDGVKRHDDPGLKEHDQTENGVWAPIG